MFENARLAALSHMVLLGGVGLLALLFLFCVIRGIKGPSIADRILSVNMSGTMIITAIVFMAGLLEDPSIVDISLLYAMISFLAVVVLSRIYRGEYWAMKKEERQAVDRQEEEAYEEGLHSDGDD